MKPRTKKIVKYSIIGAIFATLLLFFFRVWRRMKNGVASVKEGSIVMSQNKEGTYEKSLVRKSEGLKRALDASADELNLWADNIKDLNKGDWFTRLITFNFKRKK